MEMEAWPNSRIQKKNRELLIKTDDLTELE